MYDKQERLASLLNLFKSLKYTALAKKQLSQVAHLSKLDLVTQMVTEFPSLQGLMGGLYAHQEEAVVSEAISEQYLPLYYGGELPKSEAGFFLSLADRFDHLVASFYIGAKPTGSQDPLALRRIVYSIFSLLFKRALAFDFHAVVDHCYASFSNEAKHKKRLYDFVEQRLKSFLMDRGLRYDTADAVLHLAYDNVSYAVEVGLILDASRGGSIEEFKSLVETAVRVKRLAIKSNQIDLDSSLFQLDIEKKAFLHLNKSKKAATKIDMIHWLALTPSLTQYFEDVMVMDKNKTQQQNRLAFMRQCDAFYLQLADFEKIVLD